MMSRPADNHDAWLPIDSAPKDGTLLQLTAIDATGETFEIWNMQWAHIQRNGLFPGVTGMWTAPHGGLTWNGSPDDGGPTHWRPLTVSPEEESYGSSKSNLPIRQSPTGGA